MTDWKSSLRSNPIPWLLDNACPAIRYRVLTELLDRQPDDPEVVAVRADVENDPTGIKLQKTLRKDGTWGGKLVGDPRKWENSLENCFSKLLELGWNRDVRAVRDAAKGLRAYQTQKKDLKLFEFAKAVKADDRREQYYRWFLRVVTLGLLIRAGYTEEKSRLGVLELLDCAAGFVDNPISRSPTDEIGASLPLIRADAWNRGYIFMPDIYITRVLAHSPWLLDGEMAKMRLKKIFDYVLSQTYQDLAPDLGLVRTVKGTFTKGYGMAFKSVDDYQKHGNVDELLMHLESFARLGLINRYPLLMAHLEWLHSLQAKDGKWNLSTKLINDTSRTTQLLRVEKDWRSPARKEADLTFRMLLILKYQAERQVRMLDRRDDGYPI